MPSLLLHVVGTAPDSSSAESCLISHEETVRPSIPLSTVALISTKTNLDEFGKPNYSNYLSVMFIVVNLFGNTLIDWIHHLLLGCYTKLSAQCLCVC